MKTSILTGPEPVPPSGKPSRPAAAAEPLLADAARVMGAALPLPRLSLVRAHARHGAAAFPMGEASREFLARHYPGAHPAQWNDWRWQLKNRVSSLSVLETMLHLTDEEREATLRHGSVLPFAVTPYYLAQMDPLDEADPLRRTMIPAMSEHEVHPGESEDPLCEDHDSPTPGLVHRYPDRALFLATDYCSAYCRYCTRSRMVGKTPCPTGDRKRWDACLDYIARTPAIRDVVVSGGDPLTLSDAALDHLLSRLRAIPHVEIVRLGTKTPMVLPQRITHGLTRMLKKHHPLFLSVHCAHGREITPESREAFARLADAGIPLGSQTVLLKGVNDDVPAMTELMHGLLTCRVRPYYLYHCDPVLGVSHFRTSVRAGVDIIRGMRGHTSGYAVPTFVVDAPGGGGKVPLMPDYVLGRDGDDLLLTNYESGTFRTYDPEASLC